MTKKNTVDGVPEDKPSNRMYLNIHISLGEIYRKSLYYIKNQQDATLAVLFISN